MERKVFAINPEVARERSIITSGRRFTWGGRQKLALPGWGCTQVESSLPIA
jgi:hypothetical protein